MTPRVIVAGSGDRSQYLAGGHRQTLEHLDDEFAGDCVASTSV